MNHETTLEQLIGRLLGDEKGTGVETGQLAQLTPAEAAALEVIGNVFAGFDALRRQAPSGAVNAQRSAGDRVGAFRLSTPLGSGGMGDVWLAERADGRVEQRVAIKFLRLSQQRLGDWFQREQRLLARLEHPYIARFLDSGLDDGGRPYLVMEYVAGEPIDLHCDARRYTLDARLALFLRVCEAVEHAHRHLVLHRDIKPANILVADDATPRLLDFGVGKALGGEAAETEQPVFTFAYGAPEQFRGQSVSTATDVFSLGLLLFRLLAGELPSARRSASIAELALQPHVAENLSDAAQNNPAAPVPADALRGDLDAIVAKATAHDVDERYGSVALLAEDLRRYRDGLPVSARAPSRLYRMRKFVRRHRAGVAAAAIAIVALAAGFGVALWQAGVAREQARRADVQAARAERVASFMTGLLREQDPFEREASRPRPARELVADGVLRARSDLKDEPELRDALLGVLGEATMNLGDLAGARALLEDARRNVAAGSAAAARLDVLLGRIAISEGRDPQGIALLDAALPRLQAGNAEEQVFAARMQVYRAVDLFVKGKSEQALPLMRSAYESLRERLGDDNLDVLDARENLINLLDKMRLDGESEPLVNDLIARIERLSGKDSPRLLDALRYQALIERRRGNYELSLKRFERAIAVARRHLGAQHETLAMLHTRSAQVLRDANRPEDALAQLDLAEQALPASASRERAQVLSGRGEVLLDLKRVDEGERALREALRLRRAANGDDDMQVWYAQSEWGAALTAQGRLAEADAAQREALAQMERIMGPDAYQLTFVLRVLSDTVMAAGKPVEAAELRRRALALALERYPATHMIAVQYRARLAETLIAAGDRAAALAEIESILAEPEQPGTREFHVFARELREKALTSSKPTQSR